MSWSLSFANVQIADETDESGKVTTFADRVHALATMEFARGKHSGPDAQATAAQVTVAAKHANLLAQELIAGAPPSPKRATVRIYGHANWDSTAVGTHLGVEVSVD